MMEVLQTAIQQGVDPDRLEKLIALKERVDANEARAAFDAAKAKLKGELPQIRKGGTNTHTGNRYARLEDMDKQISPILAKHGFSFSFSEDVANEKAVTFIGTLAHAAGHREFGKLTVPIDKAAQGPRGPVRNAVQDCGSTTSYARRYLIKMMLDIAEEGEDTDGNSSKKITDDQEKELTTLIQDSKTDKAAFLKYWEIGELADLLASDYKKAVNLLEAKKRNIK